MGEDPRIYASKEIGREIVNHIVDRLSELAYRLLNRTGFLDRSKYIRALKIQADILAEARSIGREGYAILGSQEYGTFIQHLWTGKYDEAIKEGEELTMKTKELRRT